MSTDLLSDWGRRIAGVEGMQIDGDLTAGTLVAVLGMSTVREGLDASWIEIVSPIGPDGPLKSLIARKVLPTPYHTCSATESHRKVP